MKPAITDRPILFSAPMIRALLAGTKTQTRRAIKPVQPREDGLWPAGRDPVPDCPYGKPGDTLWCKETHALVPRTAYAQSAGVQQTVNPANPDQAAVYREGWERAAPGKWRPSIHMPRWASRISLRVTSVRVERVQDISEEDALAEGVCDTPFYDEAIACVASGGPSGSECRHAFRLLWVSINGAESWEANPWVWVVGFERVTNG